MFSTNQSKIIGLVLDISLRHLEGQRIIDVVKKQISEWLRGTLEDSEDGFYLYHPEITEVTRRRGESIASVANYSTDGWMYDLRGALAHTFWVVAAEDPDAHRSLILITDRIQEDTSIAKLFLLERREKTEMQFVLVGVGQHYKKQVLDQFSDTSVVGHLQSPTQISEFLGGHCG